MKKLFCKIFGHIYKYESEIVVKCIGYETVNYKLTCKVCNNIETGSATSFN